MRISITKCQVQMHAWPHITLTYTRLCCDSFLSDFSLSCTVFVDLQAAQTLKCESVNDYNFFTLSFFKKIISEKQVTS